MATLSFDELNKRSGGGVAEKSSKKAIPYKDYFAVMGLTPKEQELRISLADDIEEAILFSYALRQSGASELLTSNSTFSEMLIAVGGYSEIDDYIEEMTKQYSDDLAKSDSIDDEDEQKDQAMFLAEDMANAYANYIDYLDAKKSGKKQKIWQTEKDNRVRPTHETTEGTAVDIDGVFNVGGSLMRFPKDTYYGADDSEIMRCRCHVIYK